MKALSLWQPWASAVVQGKKQIETRSWSTDYRGSLLIHATRKRFDTLQLITDYNRVVASAYTNILPHGAIIGMVQLVDVVKFPAPLPECLVFTDEPDDGETPREYAWSLTAKELAFGDYTAGRFGWLFADPVVFEEPIPAKGYQRLFNYNLCVSCRRRPGGDHVDCPAALDLDDDHIICNCCAECSGECAASI